MGADREYDVEICYDGATNEKPHELLEWVNHNQSLYNNSSSESIEVSKKPEVIVSQ